MCGVVVDGSFYLLTAINISKIRCNDETCRVDDDVPFGEISCNRIFRSFLRYLTKKQQIREVYSTWEIIH